ncbi:GerMN domain-containing protein [Paenibacillus sp. GCM10027626]|uniref:GerMN domain-containing protein n=1 Tax=Paenibacillus sp. GCM10027626 TaxID=3273411 RepID=UPI003644FB84
MTQYRLIRRAALAGVLALPILTTGCGLFSQGGSKEIDPPQNSSQNSALNSLAADETVSGAIDEQGQQAQMTLYLEDHNGMLAPVTVAAGEGDPKQLGQKALEMMIDGSPQSGDLPEGFSALLPQGTEVRGFTVDPEQKLAIVDFTQPFSDYNVADERRIIEAVTWTLTGIEGIQKVELRLEGEKLNEMPVDGFPLEVPLTRAVGINLEAAEGVDYSQSTPVTLYFSAVTDHDESYYVPVTRLINRTNNKAVSAMEELIAGPLDLSKQLHPVITSDVTVKKISKKDDIVTVELEDAAYQEGQQTPAEMMQAVVLSLIDNTGLGKVQIVINGKTDLIDTNNQSYSKPVGRPERINALKL